MNYFPRLYFDELIYSTIARYSRHTASTQSVLLSLMGFNKLGFWFSYNLKSISQWTMENFNIGADIILSDHTLYNWAECLLPASQANELKKCMIEKGGKFNVLKKAQSSFNYCSLCAKEDREQFGETYWHRLHNVPFISVCVKYECLLSIADIPEQLSWKRGFFSAEEFVPREEEIKPCKEIDLEISRELNSWLRNGSNKIRERTIEILISKKALRFVNNKYYLHQEFFIEYHQFAASFVENDLHSIAITKRFFNMLYSNRNLCGFVNHFIALRKYLEHLPKGKDFTRPFVQFIPECINEFCAHFESPLATNEFYHKTVSGLPGFSATCFNCSQTYLGKLVEGKVKFTILDYGNLVSEKIASEREAGHSYREIAKIVGIDRKVIANIDKRRFNSYYKKRGANSDGFQSLLEERKNRLLNAEIRSVDDLKTTYKTEYRWLLKYDKPWMVDFTKPFHKKITGRPPKSLEALDLEALEELKVVVASLKSSNVDFQITRSIILKNTRLRISSKIGNLPKTKLYLAKITETKATFTKRRNDIINSVNGFNY